MAIEATEQITIRVDPDAARIFRDATPEERRKLEVLLSLQILEAAGPAPSLSEVMDIMSRRAQEHGLTEEKLQELLDDARS